jgi:hypothetical protein
MIRNATHVLRPALLAVAAVTLLSAAASAFSLRSPQVALGTSSLQGYLTSVGESINAATDQTDAQVWASTVSGNSTFTLQIELAGNAASNTLGIYNGSAASPALYQLFPGAASAGWFAIASFRPGNILKVNLFDATATLQGVSSYSGVDATDFGFYLSGPGGVSYSQDFRNPAGAPQALAYAGTGINVGSWWLCFEDTFNGDRDFDDAVLFLESVNPTPATTQSWGSLKARYR